MLMLGNANAKQCYYLAMLTQKNIEPDYRRQILRLLRGEEQGGDQKCFLELPRTSSGSQKQIIQMFLNMDLLKI